MDSLIFGIGALIALVMIFRFATKKGGRSGQGGGVVVFPGPGNGTASGQRQQRATLGTIIAVNVICLVGFIVALVIGMSLDEPLLRVVVGMGTLILAPWIAFKFLESQDPGKTYSLLGALAGFCIMFWIFSSMWYIGDAMQYVRSLSNG